MGRKRPPLKQLIEAGKEARKILEEKKIILPEEKSAIAKILQTQGAPMLPGQSPPYLPYPWTINAARRIVYDFGRAWQAELKNDEKRKSHGIDFFKFVIEGLNRPKSVINSLIIKTVEDKTFDHRFLSRKETIDALKRFFIDSFAIAVIAKSHTDVADYLIWFLEWTNNLLKLWPENVRSVDGKKKNVKKDNNISYSTNSSSR